MDAATLYDYIADVSPVSSTTVGEPNDRTTWSWVPGPNASQAQIDAGNNVVATLDPNATAFALSVADFIQRFTNAEYRAATGAWRGNAGNAKNWDVVVFDVKINLSKKKTITLRDSLVADGILTQARADEIFR